MLYERRHSLEIADYGGVATPAPWLSTVFLITTLASIGLPTLSNFVGEFLVLAGRGDRELSVGGLRRRGRDPLRLLHALDVPARVLRPGARHGRRPADTATATAMVMIPTPLLRPMPNASHEHSGFAHAGSERPRMGRAFFR